MKVQMSVSIEHDLRQDVDHLCGVLGIDRSKMVCDALRGYVIAGKASGLFKKKKATTADLIRFAAEGAKLDPLT